MKERPILFSAPMVRAILDGRKTQTRRVVKRQPQTVDVEPQFRKNTWGFWGGQCSDNGEVTRCPYGEPGDRLWVRETVWLRDVGSFGRSKFQPIYKATDEEAANARFKKNEIRWKPSIHMPRWASRITLEVTGVRVERLQAITPMDAIAEGIVEQVGGVDVPGYGLSGCDPKDLLNEPRDSYRALWESINTRGPPGPHSWVLNPWVWVVEFKLVKPEANR